MTHQIEIEFKNSLTKIEYTHLLKDLNLSEKDCYTQENHYYDTKDWKLKNKHSALRIRLFATSAELTLKTPLGEDLLETTDPLSLKEAQQFLNSQTIKTDGYVAKKITELQIDPKNLLLFGSLTTKRCEKRIPQGLIVLDESSYGTNKDYELEFEAASRATGKVYFEQFLKKHSIEKRSTKNKIVRMMESI